MASGWIVDERERINKMEEAQAVFKISDLAISGSDIINLGYLPGKEIGEILKILFDRVIEDPSMNEKDKLINLVRTLK